MGETIRAALARPAVQAALLGAALCLAKWPLVFETIGEQDQGRLLVDAMVYAQDGAATGRPYGVYTSPLWTLPLAGIVALFGTGAALPAANLGGWIAGSVTAALGHLWLRGLGAPAHWAAAGALAAVMLPGTFYFSLYGYPSQVALAWLLLAGVALQHALAPAPRRPALALATCGVAFVAVALTKLDFAVAGTSLLAVALLLRRERQARLLWLPVFGAIALAAVWSNGALALDGGGLGAFLGRAERGFEWRPAALADPGNATVAYACGFGTLSLFAAALVAVALRRRGAAAARLVVAWALAVGPLWLFWLARPPMTARHALPGVLFTALFAALAAARAAGPRPAAALGWPVLVVALNWGFGAPGFDVNYRPSGDLARTLDLNRRAFAVADRIADRVAAPGEPMKVVVSRGPRPEVLGNIDLFPSIEVGLAARAAAVRAIGDGAGLLYGWPDGGTTKLFHVAPTPRLAQLEEATFYAPYGAVDAVPLRRSGIPVVSFEPMEMFEAEGR